MQNITVYSKSGFITTRVSDGVVKATLDDQESDLSRVDRELSEEGSSEA